MTSSDYLDPKGYWCDPAGNLRRMSGEQEIIAVATDKCSRNEWAELCRVSNLIAKGEADQPASI